MTDAKGTNVFHEDDLSAAGQPSAAAGGAAPSWDTDLSPAAPVGADGEPIAEGNAPSQPPPLAGAGYYPAEAESSAGPVGETKVDFVPSSAGQGNYQIATERAFWNANADAAPPPEEKTSMFEIKHYQRFFDVDTMDVAKRIMGAWIFKKDLFDEVESKPDLYGPFWLCTTSIFLMAMISNALDWFAYEDEEEAWEGDLKKIARGASIMYGYVFGVGMALWAWLKVINSAYISLSAIWCMYGYSMAIWLPVTIVAIFPNPLWLWVLCLGASLYSGVFLVLNMRKPVEQSLVAARQYPTLLTMFIIHQLVAVALRVYVFTYNHDNGGKPKVFTF